MSIPSDEQTAELAPIADAAEAVRPDQHKIDQSPLARLTARQREIVKLVSQGLTNKEVARQLNLTDGTVKIHLHRIYARTRIRGRTALAGFVLRSRANNFQLLILFANAVVAILATGIVFILSS